MRYFIFDNLHKTCGQISNLQVYLYEFFSGFSPSTEKNTQIPISRAPMSFVGNFLLLMPKLTSEFCGSHFSGGFESFSFLVLCKKKTLRGQLHEQGWRGDSGIALTVSCDHSCF